MSSIRQTKNGRWRAEINRKKTRDAGTFDTRDQAEAWAKNAEKAILGGTDVEPFTLTKREMQFLFNRSKDRAKARGIEHLMTKDEVDNLFRLSCGRCMVSGIVFNRFMPANSTKRPWYPSLDRIDSSKPYTVANCRFVCVAVNIAMGEWGEWVLKSMASAVALHEPVQYDGPEAAAYSFPAIVGAELTYRQIVRRRNRKKIPSNVRQPTMATQLNQILNYKDSPSKVPSSAPTPQDLKPKP